MHLIYRYLVGSDLKDRLPAPRPHPKHLQDLPTVRTSPLVIVNSADPSKDRSAASWLLFIPSNL